MQNTKDINKWAVRGKVLWLFIKYQIISKFIIGLVAIPLFSFIMNILIKASGRTNLSSGDYIGFLFSANGLIALILGILLLVFIFGMDINTFIIISSLVEEGKLNMKIRNVLWGAFRSLKYFFSPIGVFIVTFVAVVLPLLNLGISLGPLKDFKIPNFITSVIFNTPLYYAGYVIALVLLFIISIIYIFTLHFMLIDGQSSLKALKSSRQLVFKYWKRFIIDYIWEMIKISLICIVLAIIVLGVMILASLVLDSIKSDENIIIILLLLSMTELFSFFAFLSVPITIYVLTGVFYELNQLDNYPIRLKLEHKSAPLQDKGMYGKIRLKTKIEVMILLVVVIGLNTSIAVFAGNNFQEIFKIDIDLDLVAHRGGGDLGAENAVEGIERAIEKGVQWTEIDVQRTKDGHYILNHDSDFARVTGVKKTPMEMTLAEIKELRIKNEFYPEKPDQEVPTFEEVLDACKGKIGVFVELKGKSADHQMVDDVITMIKAKNMLDECVILSLDYEIIQYTAKNYPEIKTGFLYFLSTGALKDLKGDYLIMEEGEATASKIDEIHQAGKKAVVWTVNTPESINTFIYSDVDGIITDHVGLIQEAIEESKHRSSIQIIIDSFIN